MTALALLALLPADVSPAVTLRYLKPEGGKFVLESEVTRQTDKRGQVYTSKTVRGRQTLTLTIQQRDKQRSAEIVNDLGGMKRMAQVEWRGEGYRLTRNGVNEEVKAPFDAIITSAPDWSDIFELVARYDPNRAGKQTFAGLWFHPSQATLTPTFTIERTGSDTITVKGKEEKLDRFEIRLRASVNRVWATPDRKVIKILPAGKNAQPIVLEGYEEASQELK